MELKVTQPRSDEERTIATSLRLNKAVWNRLQEESKKTKKSNETYFISCQKMVELILKQVLEDPNFKLVVPPDLVKPQDTKRKKRKSG